MAPGVGTPLVVIVGPTASGKSALAMEAAKKIGGEIIAADSRTVYKCMDIGAAKPTKKDQAEVSHHLIDLVEPGERFSAADFQKQANKAIEEIWARGHLPIMVGGTGLYVDSVLFGYQFGPVAGQAKRNKLAQKTTEELVAYCTKYNIELPVDVKNKRRLIRAVELGEINHKRNNKLRPNTLVVGTATDRSELRRRVERRAEEMFVNNVVEEASWLANKYGWDSEAMTGNIYRIVRRLLAGEIDKKQAIELFVVSDMQLAKRQMTWFKRNQDIVWSQDRKKLFGIIVDFAKQYSIQ